MCSFTGFFGLNCSRESAISFRTQQPGTGSAPGFLSSLILANLANLAKHNGALNNQRSDEVTNLAEAGASGYNINNLS